MYLYYELRNIGTVVCIWFFDFVLFCFFFFKQKTAYEMRISDWSSDVCSSDLGFQPIVKIEHDFIEGQFISDLCPAAHISEILLYAATIQIGRASCRERVCQYV